MKQYLAAMIILVIIILSTLVTVVMLLVKNNESKSDVIVSLPEEIQLAKTGDKLIIESITKDSISLGFTNNIVLHDCNWEDCQHKGQIIDVKLFKSDWGYEEETDGYYVELTHFMNPDMTYEQCEQYVFSGMK